MSSPSDLVGSATKFANSKLVKIALANGIMLQQIGY